MRTSTCLLCLSLTLPCLVACDDADTSGTGGDGATSGAGAGSSTGSSPNGSSASTSNGSSNASSGSGSASTGTGGGGAFVPEGVLFFDDFEYEVARDATNKFEPGGPFQTAGWSWGKDAVLNGTGAGGWLFTATTIPGFAGNLPGVGSSRALVVESGAGTYAGALPPDNIWRQTDFYLQYGDVEAGSLDTIPPDVWLQQWIYICDDPSQPSLFPPTSRLGKWFYPTRSGYPSQDLEWLYSLTGIMTDSENEVGGSSNELPIGFTSLGYHLNLTDTDGTIFDQGHPYAASTLGHSGTDRGYLTPTSANQWWLLRVHIDHTVTPGVVETWIRPQGGAWIKVIDTATASNVTWTPTSAVGHRGMRFPTTMNNWYQDPSQATTHGDWWIYIDDFAIAAGVNAGGEGEADLPFYP